MSTSRFSRFQNTKDEIQIELYLSAISVNVHSPVDIYAQNYSCEMKGWFLGFVSSSGVKGTNSKNIVVKS